MHCTTKASARNRMLFMLPFFKSVHFDCIALKYSTLDSFYTMILSWDGIGQTVPRHVLCILLNAVNHLPKRRICIRLDLNMSPDSPS